MSKLLFCDSFDHYNVQAEKWTIAGAATINITGTASRTGIGCLIISGVFGPEHVFDGLGRVVAGTAFYPDGAPTANGSIMQFLNKTGNVTVQIELRMLNDLAIAIFTEGAGQLARSAAGILQPNSYNYIEVDGQISHNATVVVNVNGALAISASGLDTQRSTTAPIANSWQLLGLSLRNSRHDDVYLDDPETTPIATAFRGPVKIYAQVPFSDGVPVNWIPLSGSNFSNVDEIPPDGATSFNSSSVVGDVDQYLYNLPGGFPSGSQIQAVQHVQDMQVDVGARTVASDVGGVVAAGNALTTGFVMYRNPYDLNPLTGRAWVAGDFPAAFGPKVTA